MTSNVSVVLAMLSYLHFARVAGYDDLKTSIPIEISLHQQHHSLRQKLRPCMCLISVCRGGF